jgi:hypothetical protein
MRFITEFHRNGRLTKGINATFIALIPKVSSPQRLDDFPPISLVGCMYKVLAKFRPTVFAWLLVVFPMLSLHL